MKQNITVCENIIHGKHRYISANLNIVSKEKLCTLCRYCQNCPAMLPIYRYMNAYNRLLLTSQEAIEGNEYKAASVLFSYFIQEGIMIDGEADNPCIKCGYCEERCTQGISIIERLDYIFRLAKKYGYCERNIVDKMKGFCFTYGDEVAIYPTGWHTRNMINYLDSLWKGEKRIKFIFFDDLIDGEKNYFQVSEILPISKINDFQVKALLISDFYREVELYAN